MGMIPANMRPRYEEARALALEIGARNPKLTPGQIVEALHAKGYEFARAVTVKAWRRDAEPRQVRLSMDKEARAIFGQVAIDREAPIPRDRIAHLEQFHSAAISAGGVLAEKLAAWASLIDPEAMGHAEGVALMREMQPYLETMTRLQMLIIDAKHHLPTVSPDDGRSPPKMIDGEANTFQPLSEAARLITEEVS